VANLFTFDDEEYLEQLNALAGAEYAQYLQSVLWSTAQLNRTITERMECDAGWAASADASTMVDGKKVSPTADIVEPMGCFEPGRAAIWGRVSGSFNEHDGDEEAAGYDETQFAFHVGADYAFTDTTYIGGVLGYFQSEMDFEWFGNTIDYDGLQAALYGGYDNQIWYLRGIVSFGLYDGDSHRFVAVEPGNPVDPDGEPDSNVISFYGEAGYRFDMGGLGLTPFVGVNYATAEIDGFSEDDPEHTGAALQVHDSDGESLASVLGVRFGGDWTVANGTFTPEVSLAWMHEFDDILIDV
jgi:outer membrane autotransporter protein